VAGTVPAIAAASALGVWALEGLYRQLLRLSA
jgi:hypothetical protein